MQKFLPAIFLLFLHWGVAAPVVFKGTVPNRYNNTMVTVVEIPSGRTDSAHITNGRFRIQIPFLQPALYVFTLEKDVRDSGYAQPAGVLVENAGTVTLWFPADANHKLTITGSTAQTLYEKFLLQNKLLKTVLERKQREMERALGVRIDSIMIDGHLLSQEKEWQPALYATQFVRENPKSLAAAYILENYTEKAPIDDVEAAYYSLTPKMQHSYFGERVRLRLKKLESFDKGATVADFTLPNDSGRLFRFGAVKEKVVLINFWASWCAPCREEFTLLRKAYEKYHDKSFTIISISADESESAWKTALQKEQLPWPQLRDHHQLPLLIGHRFGVTRYPTVFLLNPDRKILYRDLRGGVLLKVIEGLVSNN